MKNDFVAVLLSTYNGEKFLQEQIVSILSQSDVNISLFIRDDGSTDNTATILDGFSRDNRVKILKGPHLGIQSSYWTLLNQALSDKSYDYFAYADQDDLWELDKIYRGVSVLVGFKNSPALYCSGLSLIHI